MLVQVSSVGYAHDHNLACLTNLCVSHACVSECVSVSSHQGHTGCQALYVALVYIATGSIDYLP